MIPWPWPPPTISTLPGLTVLLVTAERAGRAADAVHDTFVIAPSGWAGCVTPSRLRPWLYAVARNECRRRWPPGRPGCDQDRTVRTGDDTTDFGGRWRRLSCASWSSPRWPGSRPDDREIVELSMRHEFYGADLADALGVPRNQARALAARGRARLESALGALLVTRSRQGSCAELAADPGQRGRGADPGHPQAGGPAHHRL